MPFNGLLIGAFDADAVSERNARAYEGQQGGAASRYPCPVSLGAPLAIVAHPAVARLATRGSGCSRA